MAKSQTGKSDWWKKWTVATDSGPRDERERTNWLGVAAAVLVSFLLWFSFTMTERYTVTMYLPTRIDNVPSREALQTLPPREIRVQVQGEGFQVIRLKYSRPTVAINAGLDEVNVRDALTDFPKGIVVQSVFPEVIRLRKGSRITKRVPIRIKADVKVPSTHDLLEPLHAEPDSVSITGAASVVRNIRYWPTEWVRREDVKDSLEIDVALEDSLHGLVVLGRRRVTVKGVAREFTEGTREIEVAVRGIPDPEQVVTLKPPTIRVRYRVLFADYFRAQSAPDFYAEVHYDQLRSDTTGFITPEIRIPPDLVIRDIEAIPSSLEYYWRIGE